MLGLAAVALYPIQGYIIPKLQWHVNQLAKARVRNVRMLSEGIGEAVSGIEEVHANDGARRILARFTERFWTSKSSDINWLCICFLEMQSSFNELE